MKTIKNLRLIVIFCLLGSVAFAREVELVSVKTFEHENSVAIKGGYKAVSCTFESIFSIEKGINVLAIRLSNSSGNPINISKLQLGLDESYEVKFAGKILPNAFNNHQSNNELEKYREKIGMRWLVVPAKSSILVSLDPTEWQSLEGLSRDHKAFQIELSSNLFHSQRAVLKYREVKNEPG